MIRIEEILKIASLATLPISELRGSILYGVLIQKLPWSLVMSVSVLANLIPSFIVMTIAPNLERLVIRNPYLKGIWLKLAENARKKSYPTKNLGSGGYCFLWVYLSL